jgi:hypothetical protein
MKITVELSAKDVQEMIRVRIGQEASKHNHPGLMDAQVTIFDGTGARGRIEDLQMEIHAVLEEKPPAS